jgi:hypothetical protein
MVLLLWSWFKSKDKPTILYEEGSTRTSQMQTEIADPIVVSSTSFPSKLISPISENSIPLEVSFYEEIWPEDGIHIEYLLNELTGKLEKLLPGIQYQQ